MYIFPYQYELKILSRYLVHQTSFLAMGYTYIHVWHFLLINARVLKTFVCVTSTTEYDLTCRHPEKEEKRFKFRGSGNTFFVYHILCKHMKKKFGKKCNYICNFFRYRYVKSDLTQSGVLTVALLFFSAKLSIFRVQTKMVS